MYRVTIALPIGRNITVFNSAGFLQKYNFVFSVEEYCLFFKRKKILRNHIQKNICGGSGGGGGCGGGGDCGGGGGDGSGDGVVLLNIVIDPFSGGGGGGGRRRRRHSGCSISSVSSNCSSINSVLVYVHAEQRGGKLHGNTNTQLRIHTSMRTYIHTYLHIHTI